MTNTAAHTIVVIPCAAAKLDTAAAARDLYASANFALTLAAAEATAADDAAYFGHTTTVMILSAEYGLLDLDTVLAPYDTKMGDKGCITADTIAAQLTEIAPRTIVSMLPNAYRARIEAAVADLNDDEDNEWIELLDVYEGARGVGDHRGTATSLKRTAA